MFDRLLRIARIAAWMSLALTILYGAADLVHMTLPHQGVVWVVTAVAWCLFAELKSRVAMCDRVVAEVDRLMATFNSRLDDYERHTIGRTLASERTPRSRTGPSDS